MGQGSEFDDNDNSSQDGGSPFSADLKGDFSSNFGTNTNAVSQIFKEGGFVGENKTRLIALVGGLVVVFALAAVYLSTGDSDYEEEDFIVADGDDEEELGLGSDMDDDLAESAPPKSKSEPKSDSLPPSKVTETLPVQQVAEDPLPSPADNLPSYDDSPSMGGDYSGSSGSPAAREEDQWPVATVAPSLIAPQDGVVRGYDETQSPPLFTWEGSPGGWLTISESQTMKPVKFRRKTSGNSVKVRKLLPGTWYWQVRNGAGSSSVRSFTIQEPVLRQLALGTPADGSSLAGSGGVVSWTGDQKVSFYRVELSAEDSWANPAYRFATSGTQLQVQNVAAGSYKLRLGAFSEVSGRWEYTNPIAVTIQ